MKMAPNKRRNYDEYDEQINEENYDDSLDGFEGIGNEPESDESYYSDDYELTDEEIEAEQQRFERENRRGGIFSKIKNPLDSRFDAYDARVSSSSTKHKLLFFLGSIAALVVFAIIMITIVTKFF